MSRGRQRVWPEELLTGLVSGRQAGLTIRALAAQVDIPERTVGAKLRELGVNGPPPHRIPDRLRQQIIDGYTLGGLSERRVARALGINRDTVKRVLDKAGVERRPLGGNSPGRCDRSQREPVNGRMPAGVDAASPLRACATDHRAAHK